MNIQTFLTFFISSTLLMGCSFFGEERPLPPPQDKNVNKEHAQTTTVQIAPLKKPSEELTDIEITLESPSVPIDGFIVRWGDSADNLQHEQRILISDLQKSTESSQKALYTYRLQSVQNDKRLFVSVASYVGESISEFSTPMEVK